MNGWWESVGELADLFGDEAAVELAQGVGAKRRRDRGLLRRSTTSTPGSCDAGDIGVATSPAQEGAWDASPPRTPRRLGGHDKFLELTAERAPRSAAPPRSFGGGVLHDDGRDRASPRGSRAGSAACCWSAACASTRARRSRASGPDRPAEAETPGGVVRAGAAVIAVNAWADAVEAVPLARHRARQLHRAHRAGARAARRRSAGPAARRSTTSAPSLHYLRTTPDGRIAFGIGGLQPGLARTIGPRFAYDERFIARGRRGPVADVPDLRDVPLEAGVGRPDRRVSGSTCRSSERSSRGACTTGSATRATASRPRTWEARSSPRSRLGADDEYTTLPIVGHRAQAVPARADPLARRAGREPRHPPQGRRRGRRRTGRSAHRVLRAAPAPSRLSPRCPSYDGRVDAAIQTRSLTKRYGKQRGIVELTLEVRHGEIFGFLGPNGAGKTTTIRTLLDLLRPTSGSARVLGMDTRSDRAEIHRRVGYLPGEFVAVSEPHRSRLPSVSRVAPRRDREALRRGARRVARRRPRPADRARCRTATSRSSG